MSAERIGDLYRELALHRVGEAIEALGASPTDRLAAQSADALEEAAAALACMTALYTSPGGRLDRQWQAQIEQLIGAAASLEQLADFDRHHYDPGPSPRRGEQAAAGDRVDPGADEGDVDRPHGLAKVRDRKEQDTTSKQQANPLPSGSGTWAKSQGSTSNA